jgi:hypothetical protein
VPLPPSAGSAGRQEIHHRSIDMRGYLRPDGLYDIEGRVCDTKTRDFAPPTGVTVRAGDFIHDIWVRMTVDTDLVVHEVASSSDSTPYPICGEGGLNLQRIVGLRIAAGWSGEVKRRLGGKQACTHLMELLIPMGTAAFQTIAEVRLARPDSFDAKGRPHRLDSCTAFSAERGVVAQRWPDFYAGQQSATDREHDVFFVKR